MKCRRQRDRRPENEVRQQSFLPVRDTPPVPLARPAQDVRSPTWKPLTLQAALLAAPVHPSNGQLQDGSDGHPQEVRHLGDGDPPVMWPHRPRRPQDRRPDDHHVNRSKGQAAQAEKQGGEGEVGHEVHGEREGDGPREPAAKSPSEDEAEGDDDDRVQDSPDQADGRRQRRPRRLRQVVVLLGPVHSALLSPWKQSGRHGLSPTPCPTPLP